LDAVNLQVDRAVARQTWVRAASHDADGDDHHVDEVVVAALLGDAPRHHGSARSAPPVAWSPREVIEGAADGWK
jgi:hypothetical protein